MTEHVDADPRADTEAILGRSDADPAGGLLDFHLRQAVQDTQLAAARRQVALESLGRQLSVIQEFLGNQLDLIRKFEEQTDYASGCGVGHGSLLALDHLLGAARDELRIARDQDVARGNS